MGKRIIQQARGHGSSTYRAKPTAFVYKIKYPRVLEGEGTVIKLLNSTAHSAPLAKILYNQGVFYIPTFKGMVEGQKISFKEGIQPGNILPLGKIPIKTEIYCIESHPGDGGKFIKAGGNAATVTRVIGDKILVMLPSKKEKSFNGKCRAVIGKIAGHGRLEKPIIKAGKMHYIRKSRNKFWPRTSAVKVNVIDHPFGSGRGKNIKSKIAKRNAPAGKRVGLIRPRRTGKMK
ncbi:MAG: 50S ribosomal protein L2 [Candidatus Pacearchaeota archaeon]|nr:50S ribosomal protein L2 [Candidatus Pacearchaeota archaeon]